MRAGQVEDELQKPCVHILMLMCKGKWEEQKDRVMWSIVSATDEACALGDAEVSSKMSAVLMF